MRCAFLCETTSIARSAPSKHSSNESNAAQHRNPRPTGINAASKLSPGCSGTHPAYRLYCEQADSDHRAGSAGQDECHAPVEQERGYIVRVFKIGDRVTVARSFGAYEAGECGTVVGQLRPYIHVALDNPRQTFGEQRAHKVVATLFQSDEIVKVVM
jgi:hypothetical protein